ncbi:PKD domain-containing protein [Methanoculleus taiwanensis]|nr:PKD domain-containing protein [Methanoculleus taiwanensis]
MSIRVALMVSILLFLAVGGAVAWEDAAGTCPVYSEPFAETAGGYPSEVDLFGGEGLGDAVTATAPQVIWARSLGGSSSDDSLSIREISGGGFVVVGSTASNNGDVSGNHGSSDLWVVGLASNGSPEWQRCLGGSARDVGRSVVETSDGGYIVAGFTESSNGDVTGNHGSSDLWVVKLSATGMFEWQKCLGGGLADQGHCILQTVDGGYILVGYTESTNGDVSGNHGGADGWVVKLTSAGGIEWQRCLGGSGSDYLQRIRETPDGGYILAGYTYSNTSGTVGTNHGSSDMYVAKLGSDGAVDWSRCLGGMGAEYGYDVVPTGDGGFLVLGITNSFDGDVTGNHGSADLWVVKLDASGSTAWQHCYGGSGADYGYTIAPTVGGYLIAGYTFSSNGDVAGLHGNRDIWAIKVGDAGSLLWQKCIGGAAGDYGYGLLMTSEGNYVIAGASESTDGDIVGNHGMWDAVAVSLGADAIRAGFTANVTGGDLPLQVGFTDTSLGAGTSWLWGFGDGNTSTARHPTHVYTAPGSYTVALTVAGSGMSDTLSKPGFITATVPALAANFTANLTGGYAPLAVQFTDSSSGAVADWLWQFGDGSSSVEQNPVHTYAKQGIYAVNLTVSDAYGQIASSSKAAYINAWTDSSEVVWMRCLGGTLVDSGQTGVETADGGYVLIGSAASSDGQVNGNHGASDVWVVRVSPTGALVWQRCFGGSLDEYGYAIAATPDGGFIAAGTAASADGDVTDVHGGYDAWLLKLDADGGLSWQKCLGGTGDEAAYGIGLIGDGGYILAGYTTSSDGGDVSGQHGLSDAWVVRVNTTGSIEWQRCIGGSGSEALLSIRPTAEGGSIAAGYTNSNSIGDIGTTKGGRDLLVVKLTGTGTTDWQRIYGGSCDDSASDVYPTADGGFIIVGSTESNDGDIIGHRSKSDCWVLRFNPVGTLLWQRCLGSAGDDSGSAIRPAADGGYLMVGSIAGTGYDVSGYRGGSDIWAATLSSSGSLLRQQCIGTSANETGHGLVVSGDGGVLIGTTGSRDGVFSENHGGDDLLVMKLVAVDAGDPEPETGSLSLSAGWNFVSTPHVLADGYNTAASVFGAVDVAEHSILIYDTAAGIWVAMNATDPVRPLEGIWVYSSTAMNLPLVYASGEAATPPAKALVVGWNAVGITGTTPLTARDALLSVEGGWTTLIGWDAALQQYDCAIMSGGLGESSDTRPVNPAEGYWLFMTEERVLGAVGA